MNVLLIRYIRLMNLNITEILLYGIIETRNTVISLIFLQDIQSKALKSNAVELKEKLSVTL